MSSLRSSKSFVDLTSIPSELSIKPSPSLPNLGSLDLEDARPAKFHRSSNGYVYQDLPTATSIRLLVLLPRRAPGPRRAKIITVDLDGSPALNAEYLNLFEPYSSFPTGFHYDCLSYVWGDRTDPDVCICDGYEVSVTRSLAGFLDVYDLDGEGLPIWIDSVCVNQNNLDELTQQVALMGRVYSQAQCVHIWLGNSNSSLDYNQIMRAIGTLSSPESHGEAADKGEVYQKGALRGYRRSFLEQAAHCERVSDAFRAFWREFVSKTWEPVYDEDHYVLCVTQFAKLLQHPWFSRAWTFQESMLARERRFRFGNRTCGEEKMYKAIRMLAFIASVMRGASKPDIDKAVNDDDFRAASSPRALHMLASAQVGGRALSLADLLQIRRGAVCQREQDIVFSLMGLAWDNHGIIIDYTKSLSQLFYKVARGDLETSGRLNVLEFSIRSQEGQNLNADGWLELPYWVPDWSNQKADYLQWALFSTHLYDCDKSKLTSVLFSTDGKRLYVEGMILASITYTVNLTKLGLTLTDISQNALSHLRRPSKTILNTNTRAILRTYLADKQLDSDNRWDSSTYEKMQSKLETKDAGLSSWLHLLRGQFALFTTNDGLLGRAPKTAQAGDIIAILWGHRVPFVLRKTPHDTYRVIGECYVDEMMDGQAIKEEGDPGYEEYLKSLTTFVFD